MLSWLKRLFVPGPPSRRQVPAAVEANVLELPFVANLDAEQRDTLLQVATRLFEDKSWEGCGGLTMTDAIKASVSGQAALLVIGRPDERLYRRVQSILVYPTAFVDDRSFADERGVMSERSASHGEAWLRGPVILDWDATQRGAANDRDGRNLIFHEFAHKLDMLDGYADGAPPADSRQAASRWQKVMLREFEELRQDAAAPGRRTFLDTYGATNPAEFFAVATEAFFERGERLKERHRDLYDVLHDYFRVDTAAWG